MITKTITVLAGLFFLIGGIFGQDPIDSSGMIRVLTYNVWNGFDWGTDEARRKEVCGWIGRQEPSIVALQELCKYTPEKLREDALSWGHPYSVLLKTSGYSVGLTSLYPIVVKERIQDGMHHGALYCEVNGMDVFVIHFHPGSIAFRRKEAAIILNKLAAIREKNQQYIVLGDFNSHSPFDADLYDPDGYLLSRMKKRHTDQEPEGGNMAYGDLDYSVMASLLAFPLMDVCRPFTRGMEERGTFPGLVLGPLNNESEEQLVSRLERIDYILTSPELSLRCTGARVCNGKENHYLSDHYPVMAEFNITGK